MFLRDLTEHATQREFVYSHAWRPFDLVMWDNRTTMHRARRFDRNEVRDVRRTTLAGDVITIEQDACRCDERPKTAVCSTDIFGRDSCIMLDIWRLIKAHDLRCSRRRRVHRSMTPPGSFPVADRRGTGN